MSGDVEALGGSLDEQIGAALQAAQAAPNNKKLEFLKKTEDLLLNRDGSAHLIDNFMDEMLEFASLPQVSIKCFVLNFIERACKKDADVMKKAVITLSFLLMQETEIPVIKRAMSACTNIYATVLKWAVLNKNNADVESCWDKFSLLKARIMYHIDSDNEGIRTMVIKFLETVVICQSVKTELSEQVSRDVMNLGDVPRDHRYLSYRKMSSEAHHCLQSLLDQTSLAHISSQNLLTVLAALVNIVRFRPEFFSRVVDCIDVLQVNLPPTLSTSQVKAVRKELKMHLLRLLKHPAAPQFADKIATLLSDLGASQTEISKAMPVEGKRKSGASKEDEPWMKKKRMDTASTSNANDEDDEDEEDDDKESMKSAIDVTEKYIFDRLNHKVVTNLVMISLATLPDQMPAAFNSTYTPIASAGTEAQRRRLSRQMASQATQLGIGPGAEMIKEQKRLAFQQRHSARTEGAIIPPTPMHSLKTDVAPPTKRMPPKVNVFLPPPAAVKSKVQMNLVTSCKEMTPAQRDRLFELTLKRIMMNEKRAMQGGASQAQHKILVRLVSRFKDDDKLEKVLCGFILEEQKARAELALLWVAEMYAQYHGFSICVSGAHDDGRFTKDERLKRYNRVLVLLLRTLFEKEEHKELLFHKIFLEAPLITPEALSYLKVACSDSVFYAFAMNTLRELVLTRSRQRDELLQLLIHLSFYEKIEIRAQAVETIKELFELPYMRNCVRMSVERQLEECCEELPPLHFLMDGAPRVWSSALFKAALELPVATLTQDHSLIHTVARVFAKCSSNDFKLMVMRRIESAVKVMGQTSSELLTLLDECPIGAEPLVARIVHLLTERAPASSDIVIRLKKLHDTRQTDVRSLLPILPGLDKDDVIKLLPKFVLSPTMAKSFGQAVKRILSTKNSDSGLSAVELIIEYHMMKTSTNEEKRLQREHVRTLLSSSRVTTKEVVSAAMEEMLKLRPIPLLIFHTVVVVYELVHSLHAFLSNVIHKIVNRDLWTENEEYEKEFFSALIATPDISYQVILSNLSPAHLEKLINSTTDVDIKKKLRDVLPRLSSHQQRSIADDVLASIDVKERPCEVRDREKEKEKREKEKEREERRDRDRRRDDRKDRDDRRTRKSYAIDER